MFKVILHTLVFRLHLVMFCAIIANTWRDILNSWDIYSNTKHKIQKKLCKSHCCRSNQPLSKLRCFFAWCALFKVATFLFLEMFVPNDSAFGLPIHVEHTRCSKNVNSKVGKQTNWREIVIHKYIKTNSCS